MIRILNYMFQINNRKPTFTWKLNNTILNDTLVKEEIKKEIKDCLEFNENEDTTFPNLWDTMKAFLRGKLIALSASKKKLERAHISSLTTHLKGLEEKEAMLQGDTTLSMISAVCTLFLTDLILQE
jgi:Rps23 Pro-64 3,4-dihydroxylase Tpa1-like proline 4-hydroxylase